MCGGFRAHSIYEMQTSQDLGRSRHLEKIQFLPCITSTRYARARVKQSESRVEAFLSKMRFKRYSCLSTPVQVVQTNVDRGPSHFSDPVQPVACTGFQRTTNVRESSAVPGVPFQ